MMHPLWIDAGDDGAVGCVYDDLTVPVGGWSFDIDNGGAATTIALAAGTYTLVEAMAEIESQLNAWLDTLPGTGRAPFYVHVVEPADAEALWFGTLTDPLGKVIIRNGLVMPSEGTQTLFSLAWNDTAFRDALGYDDDHNAEGGSLFLGELVLCLTPGDSTPGPTPLPNAAGSGLGEDIWLDLSEDITGDRIVAAHGDWQLVSGLPALRQSLIRRWLTEPGEWATKPDYGAGIRSFVKGKNTRTEREEMARRITSQALRDERVVGVDAIVIDMDDPEMLVIRVSIRSNLQPQPSAPMVVAITVT